MQQIDSKRNLQRPQKRRGNREEKYYACFAPQCPQNLAVLGIFAPQFTQNFVPAGTGGDNARIAGAAAPQFGQNL
jgi:hypothetical protein